MDWTLIALIAGAVVLLLALGGLIALFATRYYEAKYDSTFMTHDENGFNRALRGKVMLWNWEESVVKGPTAPKVGFVAIDPVTGQRKGVRLLDPKTGAVNLRPHYCAPNPFSAVTADDHKVMVDARVQFSLNRDLMKHVYEIQDFSLALETRIQSAFRAEVGKRQDEQLRASLGDVERAVIEQLRQAEADGDEEGEAGMALGVKFHSASFTYEQPDEFTQTLTVLNGGASASTPEQQIAARAAARTQGVLALRPQQLDQIVDVFKNRDPAATQALLAILDMQTRQNIAEALAGSRQLVVLTAQELGLFGAAAQHDAVARHAADMAVSTPNGASNGGLGARPHV